MASSSNPTVSTSTATGVQPAATATATSMVAARQEQLRYYRRPPIFGKDDNFVVACKTTSFSSKFNALLLGDEDEDSAEWGFLPPEGTLRFRLERGDFPWSHIDFEAPGGSPANFAAWNSHMQSSHADILTKIGLQRAKWFGEFTLSKNNAALPVLVSGWNVTTHTFIAAWGEFTITLEDVCELLGLEATGHEPYTDEALDAQEAADRLELDRICRSCIGSSNKATFSPLISYFFKDSSEGSSSTSANAPGQGTSLELPAYILVILSRFLLTGKPNDQPRRDLVNISLRLARGIKLPLAAIDLGSLYTWLDRTLLDMERSLGRYNLANFANGVLLTGFLYVCFPVVAARLNEPPRGETILPPRSYLYHKRQSRKELISAIDRFEDFVMRPYEENIFVYNCNFFQHEPRMVQVGVDIEDPLLPVVLLFSPGYLPSYTDWGYTSEHYNPNRCSRQFGFDQGAPRPVFQSSNPKVTFSEACSLFSSSAAWGISEAMDGRVTIPSNKRQGDVTPLFATKFWPSQLA